MLYDVCLTIKSKHFLKTLKNKPFMLVTFSALGTNDL